MSMSTWALIRPDRNGNYKIRILIDKEDGYVPGSDPPELVKPDFRKKWVNVTGQTAYENNYYDLNSQTVSAEPTHFIITNYEFWDRFTQAEQEDLLDHTNKQIKWAVNWLQFNPTVDIKKTKVINAINALETAGVIGTGRAAEILATT